jgi:hypothetical protein
MMRIFTTVDDNKTKAGSPGREKKMADKIRLQSGFYSLRCTKVEIEKTWEIVNRQVKQDCYYTPNDNLAYRIISETEVSCDSYITTISANKKVVRISHNICNQDAKVLKAVRKCFQ